MTKEELFKIIGSAESYRLEKTVSTSNMDKFQEAICAFANDLPGKREKGYLLIGVTDDGHISGLSIDDALMKKISGIRSDGNILPLPVMSTEKVTTDEGDVLVVEVTPSFDTPVRYRGRTFVRIGPRRDIASAEEERILAERCAASLPTFDTRPCREATIDDIDTDMIVREYLPKAIDKEVLANDHRPLKEQLAALHLFNMQFDCPTYASLIMFGRNPRYFMMGDFIQFVHFRGESAEVGTYMTGKHLDGLGLDIDIMFMKILRDEGCDLIVVETFAFVDDADLLNGFGSGFACVEFAVLVAKYEDCCGCEVSEIGLEPLDGTHGLRFPDEHDALFRHHGIGVSEFYDFVHLGFGAIEDVEVEVLLVFRQHGFDDGIAQFVNEVVFIAHEIIDGSHLLRFQVAQDVVVCDAFCCHGEYSGKP